jgi:hypothetical protein
MRAHHHAALAAPAKYSNCLASMLPDTRSGNTSTSALPANAIDARRLGRNGMVDG